MWGPGINSIVLSVHGNNLKERKFKNVTFLRHSVKCNCKNSTFAIESFDINKPILENEFEVSQ